MVSFCLFSPLFGEAEPTLTSILFRWVETTNKFFVAQIVRTFVSAIFSVSMSLPVYSVDLLGFLNEYLLQRYFKLKKQVVYWH